MWQFWVIFVILVGMIITANYYINKYTNSKLVSINDFKSIVITYNIKQDNFYLNNGFEDIGKGIYTATDFNSFFDVKYSFALLIRAIKQGQDVEVGRTFKTKLRNGSKYNVRIESESDSRVVFDMTHSQFEEMDKDKRDGKGIATNQAHFIARANEALVKYSKSGKPSILFKIKIAGYERVCKKYSVEVGTQILKNLSRLYTKKIKKSIVLRDMHNGCIFIFAPIQKDGDTSGFEQMFLSALKNVPVAGINFALSSITTGTYVDESKFSELLPRFEFLEMEARRYTPYYRIYDPIADSQKYREYLQKVMNVKEDIKEDRIDLSFGLVYDLKEDETIHNIVKAEPGSANFEDKNQQENFLEINDIKYNFDKASIRKVMEKIFANESLKNKMFHIDATSNSVSQSNGIKIPVGYVKQISITITDWSYNEKTSIRRVLEFLKSNSVKIGLNHIYSFETLKAALTLEPDFIFVSKKLLMSSYENGINKDQLRLINGICAKRNIIAIFENVDTRLDLDLVLSVGGRYIQGEMVNGYSKSIESISEDNQEEIDKAKQYVID